jgi:hypothetical protein
MKYDSPTNDMWCGYIHLSRDSIVPNPSVILLAGDIVTKHGNMMKDGWSEYSGLSSVTVTSNVDGVIVLGGCPDAQLDWWGNLTKSNNLMLRGNIHFHWSDAGVHTVLNIRETSENRRLRTERLVANGVASCGVFFNKELFNSKYVLYSSVMIVVVSR